MRSSGIDCLEVPVLWPTLEEYDESIAYTLEDPKLIPKGDSDKWKTITCHRDRQQCVNIPPLMHLPAVAGAKHDDNREQ